MNIIQVSPRLNNQYNGLKKESAKQQRPAFMGAPVSAKTMGPIGKLADRIENKMAIGIAKTIQVKPFEKFIKATQNSPEWIKDNLFAHLIVLGSTALSGAYIIKTLKNDNLEEKQRKTLALNQGIVYLASTAMAYTFDKMLNAKTKKIIEKYKKINAGNPKLDKYIAGIKIAKTTIIIDMVYRFIAPVAVTPIANHFGNKIGVKKDVKSKAPANK